MQHLKCIIFVVFATVVIQGRDIRPAREREVCWIIFQEDLLEVRFLVGTVYANLDFKISLRNLRIL